MQNPRCAPLAAVVSLLAAAGLAAAQQPAGGVPTSGDAQATVRAVRISGQVVRVDGRLDEPVWQTATPASGFRQREPQEGAAASEATDVRVLYDENTLYIGIVAHDREPDAVISRLLQRDQVMSVDFFGAPIFAGDDAVAILLDTFHDHRNAFVFATNPNGAEFDALITDEGREFNRDWRGVWRVAAVRTSDGWSAEFAIPFRTLRYPAGDTPWGFNVARVIRRKNEETLWQSWKRDGSGFARVSNAGTITGLTGLPREGINLEVKPYSLGAGDQTALTTGSAGGAGGGARPTVSGASGAFGVDLKTELRPGLVLDGTLNTDFAQVEVDDQQVNLTRFSLFYPEKRDFFLENAGIFQFGATAAMEPPPFLLFFSRRIGLSDSGAVPVIGGARLTGRVGGQTVGFLDITTDATPFDIPRRNFAVLRAKRDVGDAGYVGAMVTDLRDATHSNTAGGVDWSFWPARSVNVQGFAARTATSTPGGDDGAYRLAVDYQTGRLGITAQHLMVGPDANAEMGFITRNDIRRTNLDSRLTFRPNVMGLRTFQLFYFGQYVTRTDQLRQDVLNGLALNPRWNSGESFTVYANRGRTRVDDDFDIADSVHVRAGDYANTQVGVFASTSTSRPVSLHLFAQRDWVYGGRLLTSSTMATINGGPHLTLGLGLTHNEVELPLGHFRADLLAARVGVAFTTKLFLNTLVQVNTLDRAVSANVRFNYIYRPGSDFYVVLNEQRGDRTLPWEFKSRGVRLKLTYLARI